MERRHLHISPWSQGLLQPGSVDVTVGDEWVLHDPAQRNVVLRDRDIRYLPPFRAAIHTLPPRGFVLGTTQQTVHLDDTLSARFEGKSSVGRHGLLTHVSAGFIDPGFCGQITLEIVNLLTVPIDIHAGTPIGQLVFTRMFTRPSAPYGDPKWGSRYQYQSGTTGARP